MQTLKKFQIQKKYYQALKVSFAFRTEDSLQSVSISEGAEPSPSCLLFSSAEYCRGCIYVFLAILVSLSQLKIHCHPIIQIHHCGFTSVPSIIPTIQADFP